jgi:hypothetical protein
MCAAFYTNYSLTLDLYKGNQNVWCRIPYQVSRNSFELFQRLNVEEWTQWLLYLLSFYELGSKKREKWRYVLLA